ncbi:DUF3365 domain-containing protein [Desulfobacterales bacterium HSG17]|nr:DUF3365 domain-containing protein [Desulfobacterales bacterium HSG17]
MPIEKKNLEKGRIWRNFIINISLIIILFLMGILIGFVIRTNHIIRYQHLTAARAHFRSIVLTRSWSANHGGVFVKKEKGIVSNPYLENPDIQTIDGTVYTKKNPALMTREISEIAEHAGDFRYHITSLMALNPDNVPDDFENMALELFEKGNREKFAIIPENGKTIYRYMAPLFVEKSCLACHSKQGYKIGDVRGGISVTFDISDVSKQTIFSRFIFIGLSILVSSILLTIIFSIVSRLARRLDETMNELKDLNDNLEFKVQERTIELKNANVQLREAQEIAETANRAKSNFLMNMGHELRTPLNSIIGSADMALHRVQKSDNETFKRILNSARRLLTVLNTIIDFSKAADSKIELDSVPFRLDEVLSKLPNVFVHKGVQKRVAIHFDITGNIIPNALIGDPDHLTEMFCHLLDNAAKFSHGDNPVTIGGSTRDMSEKKATLDFYIKDNGVGISSQHFEKIFEPFFQCDASSTRHYDGTGMGLAMSKRLVELMGGTIRVESKIGEGSTFFFTLTFERQALEHAFEVPSIIDKEEVAADLPADKADREVSDPTLLNELLLTLDSFIEKRKSKQCRDIIEKINAKRWPEPFEKNTAVLFKLIKRYKFKEAKTLLDMMAEQLSKTDHAMDMMDKLKD